MYAPASHLLLLRYDYSKLLAPERRIANQCYLQVLRWSALGLGVFYGAYHQLSISAANKVKLEQREWDRKESLIRQAKQEWAKLHPQEQPKASGGTLQPQHYDFSGFKHVSDSRITDPNDPNADLNTILGITDK